VTEPTHAAKHGRGPADGPAAPVAMEALQLAGLKAELCDDGGLSTVDDAVKLAARLAEHGHGCRSEPVDVKAEVKSEVQDLLEA
jgi:hypothetical protein